MTSNKIKALIKDHESKTGSTYQRYQRYYEGNNTTIQDKQPQPEPDNRKTLAYSRIAVNRFVGYMCKPGNIVYKGIKNKTIDMLNSIESQLDESHCFTLTLTNGVGYKIFWQENKELKYAVIKPENVILEWTNDIKPVIKTAYYYYETESYDDDGKIIKTVIFWKYTEQEIERYVSINDNDFVLDPKLSMANPIKIMPLVEFIINPEKRNLFYPVMNLIDLQDELISSNMANEVQTIANAILALYGKYLDDQMPDSDTGETERDKFLKAKIKILDGLNKESGEYAEWIVKNVQWEGIFGIYDRIRAAIYEILEIPDLQDDQFQNAESGRAMAYKLWAFENRAAMIESYYKKGMMKQLEVINAFPTVEKVDIEKVQIEFKRNIPEDREARIKEAVEIATIAGAEEAIRYLGDEIIPKSEKVIKRIQEKMANEINLMMQNEPEPQIEES